LWEAAQLLGGKARWPPQILRLRCNGIHTLLPKEVFNLGHTKYPSTVHLILMLAVLGRWVALC
jgi:hypothetical protein